MEKITKPDIKTLATGSKLIAKQMQANSGDLLPVHKASLESIVLVQEGECIFNMNDEKLVLKTGDALVVPPEIKHQLQAKTDFKAVHFMSKEIKFEFFM